MKQEPVLTAASIAGVIAAGFSFARLMGWVDLTDDQFNSLMVFLGLLLPIVLAFTARGKVTPLSNPRDNQGAPLMRSDGTSPATDSRRHL